MATKTKEPTGVIEAVTPNGTRLYYQEKPKRLYRLGEPIIPPVDGLGEDYVPPMLEVPSCTTVLDILSSAGLPWWGMQVGIAGVHKLAKTKEKAALWAAIKKAPGRKVDDNPLVQLLTAKEVGLLTKHKLTVNHVRDQAADRGLDTHSLLEQLIGSGSADISQFDPEHQGYYSAVLDAWIDAGWEDSIAERMVGSLLHGFAGRFDLETSFPKGGSVMVTSIEKDTTERFFGRWRIDLKTSKRVFSKHALQLAGYELASIECGYEPTDGRAVLHVTPDGHYQFVDVSYATGDQYIAVKEAWSAMRSLEGAARAA